MHPILYSRMAERKDQDPNVQIVSLQTLTNRSSDEPADIAVVLEPRTDLALASAIARRIVKEGLVSQDCVNQHSVFMPGLENIHFGKGS